MLPIPGRKVVTPPGVGKYCSNEVTALLQIAANGTGGNSQHILQKYSTVTYEPSRYCAWREISMALKCRLLKSNSLLT
jgi:hypothetical protein